MPLSQNGNVYMCMDRPDGGSLRYVEPLTALTLGIACENDVVNKTVGRRVLGVVFSDPTPYRSSTMSRPVLVMGKVEINPDDIDTPAFNAAVIKAYASCPAPRADGTCLGVDTCKLASLLIKHKKPDGKHGDDISGE